MRFINEDVNEGPVGPAGPQGPAGAGWTDSTGCYFSRTNQVVNNGFVYTKVTMVVRRLTNEASANPTFDAGSNNIKVPSTPSTSQRYKFTLLFNVSSASAYDAFQLQLRDQSNNVITQVDVPSSLAAIVGPASLAVSFQAVLSNPTQYSLWTSITNTTGNYTINSMTGIMTLVNTF